MKKKIRDLKGSNDWLLENGNRVRLTGNIWYHFHSAWHIISVEHEMGIRRYQSEEGTDAAELEVEIELA